MSWEFFLSLEFSFFFFSRKGGTGEVPLLRSYGPAGKGGREKKPETNICAFLITDIQTQEWNESMYVVLCITPIQHAICARSEQPSEGFSQCVQLTQFVFLSITLYLFLREIRRKKLLKLQIYRSILMIKRIVTILLKKKKKIK